MIMTGRPIARRKTCQNATVSATKLHTDYGQGIKPGLLDERVTTNRLSQVSGRVDARATLLP